MRVFLVRHTPVGLPPGVCYGRADVPLAPGWEAAWSDTRRKLPPGVSERAALYSSPLARCLTLARSLGRTVTTDARLAEFDFGEWELRRWVDIPRAELDRWSGGVLDTPAPGGECLRELDRRAGGFLGALATRGHDDAVVVTHAGVIRCLLARASGEGPLEAFRLRVDYGSVSLLEVAGDEVGVRYANR